MAKCITDSGGLAILHRFMSVDEQLQIVKELDSASSVGVSIGVKESDYGNVKKFYDAGVRIFCIDIAHGHSKSCIDMTKYVSDAYPDVFLIAGNVATALGAEYLWKAGADAVKVGVGPGSLCTTRIETGNGVPQLTALSEVADRKHSLTSPHREWTDRDGCNRIEEKEPEIKRPIYMIADGGIKNAGDMVKAMCFADMVMAGNLFAGTDEAPGDKIMVDGKQFKRYDGSSTHKTNHVEGVTSLVPAKGKTSDILASLCEGIRSGLSYQGCTNFDALRSYPQFVRITSAGLRESHPHDVLVIK
jgi:IMP dehydrogenase